MVVSRAKGNLRFVLISIFALYLSGCATLPDNNERIISDLKHLDVTITEDERGLVISLPTVYFDFDSSNLKTSSRAKIAEIANVLNQDYTLNRDIEIEGHTDNTGEPDYNMNLSTQRAEVVLKELAFSNIAESRMRSSGKGETSPIENNSTVEGRRKNRRVEIILLKP